GGRPRKPGHAEEPRMTPLVIAAGDPTLADFGHDTWWLVVIKVLFLFLFLLLGTIITIWAERRLLGYMQNRVGPNRAGPFGLLQTLVDGIKLALMEASVPRGAARALVSVAP